VELRGDTHPGEVVDQLGVLAPIRSNLTEFSDTGVAEIDVNDSVVVFRAQQIYGGAKPEELIEGQVIPWLDQSREAQKRKVSHRKRTHDEDERDAPPANLSDGQW
jgi:hypothetical protein